MDKSISSADTELHVLRPASLHSTPRFRDGPLVTEELTDGGRVGRVQSPNASVASLRDGLFTKASLSPPSSFYVRHLKRRRLPRPSLSFCDLFMDPKLLGRLLDFVDVGEVARFARLCRSFATGHPQKTLKKRKRQLVLAGLKPHVRERLWRWVALQSHPTAGFYAELQARTSPSRASILADIRRIDYELTEAQQKVMLRVLSTLAYFLPDVGYCQSLVFVAAVLVQSTLSEEDCFWVLHSLLVHYDFRSVVAGGFEKLKLLCFQFDCFLNEDLKPVAEKLQQAEFSADLYALRWLLTLFSYELPHAYSCVLWDLFFLERWKVMIRAGLAFVQTVNSSRKLASGSELFCLLRDVSANERVAQEVLRTMHSFKVTQRLLDSLQEFYSEDAPPALQLVTSDGKSQWLRREEESQWVKTQALLDETLCLEDFTGPGGPLSVYCQWKTDWTLLVCANCGAAAAVQSPRAAEFLARRCSVSAVGAGRAAARIVESLRHVLRPRH